MMIRSRVRLMPASTRNGVSRIPVAPGPPVMKTTGSGCGDSDTAGTIATANRIVRPFGFERLSGTTRDPHRAVCRAGIGSGVFGQGPDSNRAVATPPDESSPQLTRANNSPTAKNAQPPRRQAHRMSPPFYLDIYG